MPSRHLGRRCMNARSWPGPGRTGLVCAGPGLRSVCLRLGCACAWLCSALGMLRLRLRLGCLRLGCACAWLRLRLAALALGCALRLGALRLRLRLLRLRLAALAL